MGEPEPFILHGVFEDLLKPIKSSLVNYSERFSLAADLPLVPALIGLTLGVVRSFLPDVMRLLSAGVERGSFQPSSP